MREGRRFSKLREGAETARGGTNKGGIIKGGGKEWMNLVDEREGSGGGVHFVKQ